jgi:hypothetical protein
MVGPVEAAIGVACAGAGAALADLAGEVGLAEGGRGGTSVRTGEAVAGSLHRGG